MGWRVTARYWCQEERGRRSVTWRPIHRTDDAKGHCVGTRTGDHGCLPALWDRQRGDRVPRRGPVSARADGACRRPVRRLPDVGAPQDWPQAGRAGRRRRSLSLATSLVALAAVLVPGGASAQAWPSLSLGEGIRVPYPPGWVSGVSPSGLVAITGPRARWGRPSVTIEVIPRVAGSRELAQRAARALPGSSSWRLLGSQRLGSAVAMYYVSQDTYVMVGASVGTTSAVVIVCADPRADPDLRTRARIFQAMLVRATVP